MESEYIDAKDKRKEIEEFVENIILNNISCDLRKDTNFNIHKISSEITDRLVQIIPPEYEDSPCRKISLCNGGISGGQSIKPGNILLNWQELLEICSDGVLGIVGVYSTQLLLPLVALSICNKILKAVKIEITEREASVVWAMWKYRDSDNFIRNEVVLDLVNKELSSYSRPQMTIEECEIIIKELEKMKCIKKEPEKNKWKLCEKVECTY